MACPDCKNFMIPQSIGGMCHKQCISCGRSMITPGLIIHTSKQGAVQQVGGEDSTDREYEMGLENLSYDNTLHRLSDKLCPKCKSTVSVWFTRAGLYIYLCPKCNQVIR